MLTWHTLMPKCTISWSIVKSAASGKLLQFLDRQSALITQGAKQLRSSRLLVTARNTEAFDEHLGVMQLHSVFLLSALGSWMPKVQNKHWRCTTDCQHPTLTLVCKKYWLWLYTKSWIISLREAAGWLSEVHHQNATGQHHQTCQPSCAMVEGTTP